MAGSTGALKWPTLFKGVKGIILDCDFSVSPSPFGLDFGTLDFGLWDFRLGLDKIFSFGQY